MAENRDIQALVTDTTNQEKLAEIKTRTGISVKNSSSGNSAAKLLKGWLFWNKGSYLLIDNAKHIHLFHESGSSEMHFVDGVITEDAITSITEKTPKHYIDSPDCKVGHGAMHPDTKCDGLMALLTTMATALDLKFGVPSAMAAAVSAAYPSICSSIVKIAD